VARFPWTAASPRCGQCPLRHFATRLSNKRTVSQSGCARERIRHCPGPPATAWKSAPKNQIVLEPAGEMFGSVANIRRPYVSSASGALIRLHFCTTSSVFFAVSRSRNSLLSFGEPVERS